MKKGEDVWRRPCIRTRYAIPMSIQTLLGKKIGTTQLFREDTGEAVCVTAIATGPCTVTQIKTMDADGYEAVQIGFEEVRRRNMPEKGHLRKSGDKLFRHLREVRASDISAVEVGQQFDAGLFEKGESINVTGITKGRGFAGGVKRHGFKGGPKTHGQSDRHRAPGSIGAGSTPGKVMKGLRMAGRMGGVRVTTKNLEVMKSDPDSRLIFVKGSVPGGRNSLLMLSKRG